MDARWTAVVPTELGPLAPRRWVESLTRQVALSALRQLDATQWPEGAKADETAACSVTRQGQWTAFAWPQLKARVVQVLRTWPHNAPWLRAYSAALDRR